MLVLEIAAGVFLGGIALWAFTSHLEQKKRAQAVEKQIASLFDVADRWIAGRFATLSPNYLDVFRQRLTTIFDDPRFSPLVAAQAEFEIFIKNTDKLKSDVKAEIQEALKEELSTADKLGAREKLDEHIDRQIGSAVLQLSNDGMLHYTKTLLSGQSDESASVAQEQSPRPTG
jgi:hypothetical protein